MAAAQKAARQRAPRDHPHALVAAQGQHVSLFLAVYQIVKILHGDKFRHAHPVGGGQVLSELPGMHRRGADIACLASFHDIVKRLDGLLHRGVMIEAMDLVEIDIIHA